MNGQLNQRPDLVIFDMDGLILDSERLFMEQERIVCLQYGYDMTPENYITTIGTAGETLRKILRDLYGEDYPMEKISRESRERVNRIIEAQGPPVKPGIGELMEALYRNKIPFCICTSTDTDTATHYMEMAGFLPYLQFLKGGEQVTRSKPDPEIFLQACEKAGVRGRMSCAGGFPQRDPGSAGSGHAGHCHSGSGAGSGRTEGTRYGGGRFGGRDSGPYGTELT